MRTLRSKLSLVLAALALAIAPAGGMAQTFRVLRNLGGDPGIEPFDDGRLVYYKGDLYGTTSGGLTINSGNGVVFRVNTKSRAIEPVYSLHTSAFNGTSLFAAPIADSAGNLYGVAAAGGVAGPGLYSYGTIYKVGQDGTSQVLHTFTGPDGGNPSGPLFRDQAGNLYGTTVIDGTNKNMGGTVFKLDTGANLTTLHNFRGPDGFMPHSGVVVYKNKVYGTTTYGGSGGNGVVFQIDLDTLAYHIMIDFSGGNDGSQPIAGMIRHGNTLYGTTTGGGTAGLGVVFALDVTTGQETILHNFLGAPSDGSLPFSPVLRDAKGNLYGTTIQGGSETCGCGTVFKLDASGNYTVLYNFQGHAHGSGPVSGLVMDASGNLYGTAQEGGVGAPSKQGPGVIYEVTP